jgi:uncharacterized protein YndB with AHSA1/START domain
MGGIRLEFGYPVPPDQLWSVLTDRYHLAAWFTDTDFVPEPGRRFMIWPAELPGLDEPISAVVLEVAPPQRLVLGWQGPHSQTTMTWALRATPEGCRLEVQETGHLGTDVAARERTLEHLFDRSLRGYLTRMPAPAPVADEVVAAVGAGPGSSENVRVIPRPAAAVVEPEPVVGQPDLAELPTPTDSPEDRTRRTGSFVAVGVVLLLLLGFGIWLTRPGGSARSTPPDGGAFGAAPTTGAAGSSGSGPGAGPSADPGSGGHGPGGPAGPVVSASAVGGPVATSPGSGGGGSTSGPGAPAPAHLTVATPTDSGLLPEVVTVTITNDGGSAGAWRAVTVRLGGLDLVVSNVDSTVTPVSKPPTTQCFYPTGGVANIAPGASFSFTFRITLPLGHVLSGPAVKSVGLDASPC